MHAHGDGRKEDRPPTEHLGDRTADYEAGNGPERADRGPCRDRLRAAGAFGERGGEDAECRRREQRATDSLRTACRDEDGSGRREAAPERRHGEEGGPDKQGAPPPEGVASASSHEQEAAKRDCVGGHHPLRRYGRDAEIALNGRQRDVDDRHVQNDQELAGAEQRQQ